MSNKNYFPEPTIDYCVVCDEHTEVLPTCIHCIKQNNDWSECECKTCGHKWNAADTEHFNISFCNSCHGTKIGGKYYEQEDKWSDIYDAFHTAIEESALQGTTEYHDLEEETHTLAEECKRINDVFFQERLRDELFGILRYWTKFRDITDKDINRAVDSWITKMNTNKK